MVKWVGISRDRHEETGSHPHVGRILSFVALKIVKRWIRLSLNHHLRLQSLLLPFDRMSFR